MKTCGSTLSNACSRSFIAYLAKSAAVAYGEVDCSSPKTFGAPATARLKQTAKSLFMQTAASSIRFRAFRQGEFSQETLASKVLDVFSDGSSSARETGRVRVVQTSVRRFRPGSVLP